MAKTFRRLKEGEIIRVGDEVDNCTDGWQDDAKWEKTTCVGEKAPNPDYPSHRQYRRAV